MDIGTLPGFAPTVDGAGSAGARAPGAGPGGAGCLLFAAGRTKRGTGRQIRTAFDAIRHRCFFL